MSAGSSSTSSKADPSDQNAVRQQQAFVGDAELELERFRREWQQEVAQRKPPENRSEREHQHQRQRSAGSANGAKPSSSALPSAGAEPKDDSTDGGRAPASPSRTKWRDPQEATEGAAGSAGVGEGEDQEDGATSHNGPSSSSSPSSSKWGSLIASSALPFQTTTTSRRAAPGSTNTQRFSAAAPALANEGTQIQMKGAVEAYAHAVEMERAGRLDEGELKGKVAAKVTPKDPSANVLMPILVPVPTSVPFSPHLVPQSVPSRLACRRTLPTSPSAPFRPFRLRLTPTNRRAPLFSRHRSKSPRSDRLRASPPSTKEPGRSSSGQRAVNGISSGPRSAQRLSAIPRIANSIGQGGLRPFFDESSRRALQTVRRLGDPTGRGDCALRTGGRGTRGADCALTG